MPDGEGDQPAQGDEIVDDTIDDVGRGCFGVLVAFVGWILLFIFATAVFLIR